MRCSCFYLQRLLRKQDDPSGYGLPYTTVAVNNSHEYQPLCFQPAFAENKNVRASELAHKPPGNFIKSPTTWFKKADAWVFQVQGEN